MRNLERYDIGNDILKSQMNKQLSKIADKLKKDEWYRVSFLGDSITSTEWVHPNWREMFEIVLKDKLTDVLGDWRPAEWKIRFYNAGFDGASTQQLSSFVSEEVLPNRPDLVIFMDSYNDEHHGISPDDHKNNLQDIFDKILDKDIDLAFASSIFVASNKENEKNRPYLEAAEEICEEHKGKIQHIDLFEQFSKLDLQEFFTFTSRSGNKNAEIQPGGIDFNHPNQLGNAYIAKILLKDIFDIDFDAESYIKETLEGKKYPGY